MTIIVDAAPLVAVSDRDDPLMEAVADILRKDSGPFVIPAPVTAEVDSLISERVGKTAERAFLDDLAAGRYHVACLEADEYTAVVDLDRRYSDLELGLADLAVVVLARRFRTRRLLTFDHRHFRAVRPLQGGSFSLLPEDEP